MSKKPDPLENALVQKSRPLFSLWKEKEKINLFEYKMLDMYLARINSRDPDKRTVSFSMEDLSEIMSVHLSKAELHEKLKKLQGLVVSNGDNEAVTLFEYSKINVDENNFDVQLMCTQTAHKYFFNIENIGYFKYKFRNILELTSMYSYILFNYLEMNRFRQQPFDVSVEELKSCLNCNDECYKSFFRFNDLVLKKCHREITEKTELQFTYSTVKNGRSVVAIRFDIAKLKNLEFNDNVVIANATEKDIEPENNFIEDNTVNDKMSDAAIETSKQPDDMLDKRIGFFSACFDDTFNELQVQLILASVNHEMIEDSTYGLDIAQYDYLDRMYKRLLIEEKERDIKNRFKYFVSMIKNDKVKGSSDKKTDETDTSKYDFIINKF